MAPTARGSASCHVKQPQPTADTSNVLPSNVARDPEAFAAWQREQAVRRHVLRQRAYRIGAVGVAGLLHLAVLVSGWNAIGNYQEARDREERAASYQQRAPSTTLTNDQIFGACLRRNGLWPTQLRRPDSAPLQEWLDDVAQKI